MIKIIKGLERDTVENRGYNAYNTYKAQNVFEVSEECS